MGWPPPHLPSESIWSPTDVLFQVRKETKVVVGSAHSVQLNSGHCGIPVASLVLSSQLQVTTNTPDGR